MSAFPERTCLGCGTKRPKQELIRLALSSEGQLQVDRAQVEAGRGAYLCGRGCLSAAVKRKAFSRVFKGRVDHASLAGLEAALGALGGSHGESGGAGG